MDNSKQEKLLLAVLDGDLYGDLTSKKTASIMWRDNSKVTGFIVTDPQGNIGIVNQSAVRWLSKDEMWWLMHDSTSPINEESANGI